jgi:uncharacterized membrane protein YraQ (UPF0718 family)
MFVRHSSGSGYRWLRGLSGDIALAFLVLSLILGVVVTGSIWVAFGWKWAAIVLVGLGVAAFLMGAYLEWDKATRHLETVTRDFETVTRVLETVTNEKRDLERLNARLAAAGQASQAPAPSAGIVINHPAKTSNVKVAGGEIGGYETGIYAADVEGELTITEAQVHRHPEKPEKKAKPETS